MMLKLWSRKGAVLVAAVAASAALIAFMAFSLASPQPVSSAALGPDWQCSRVAFLLTTCSRTGEAGNHAMRVRAKEDCPPPGI
jgi:hypothetical protein